MNAIKGLHFLGSCVVESGPWLGRFNDLNHCMTILDTYNKYMRDILILYILLSSLSSLYLSIYPYTYIGRESN